jgi:hypothetical protein
MHIAKIHVACASPMWYHHFIRTSSGGVQESSYMLHVFFRAFILTSAKCLFEALMYVVINYQNHQGSKCAFTSSNARGLHEQASWMHTHLVLMLSFHTLIALSASVAWQSLLLALTSIDGHIHSPLISLIDVRLNLLLSSPY